MNVLRITDTTTRADLEVAISLLRAKACVTCDEAKAAEYRASVDELLEVWARTTR